MFKIICDGISGDDGIYTGTFFHANRIMMCRLRANAFTYEYTFRMWNDIKVFHIFTLILIPALFLLSNVISTGMTMEPYWSFRG